MDPPSQTSMRLFLDEVEGGRLPAIALEAIAQSLRKRTDPEAHITSDGHCILLCENTLLIWRPEAFNSTISRCSPSKRILGTAHVFKLNLLHAGLHHSLRSLCIFQHVGTKHTSAIAVSPTGHVRYWPSIESSASHNDQEIKTGGEVVTSVCQLASTTNTERFIATTTTGLYLIELVRASPAETPEENGPVWHVVTSQLHLTSVPGSMVSELGRRIHGALGSMLFGAGGDREREVIKVLPLASNSHPWPNADVCILSHKDLKFISTTKGCVRCEISDVQQLVNTATTWDNHSMSEMRLVDADLFSNGLLLLLAGKGTTSQGIKFVLGFLRGNADSAWLDSAISLTLPSQLTSNGDQQAEAARLMSLDESSCAIIFPSVFLHVQNPTNVKTIQSSIVDFPDKLLGFGKSNAVVPYLLFKTAGLRAVRLLPAGFDLNFWKRCAISAPMMGKGSSSNTTLLNDAFFVFCNKDLKRSKAMVDQLLRDCDAAELDKLLVDHATALMLQFQRAGMSNDCQRKSQDFRPAIRYLANCFSLVKMLLIFVRHHAVEQLLSKLRPSAGIVLLAQLEENVVAAFSFAKWLQRWGGVDGEMGEFAESNLALAIVAEAAEEMATKSTARSQRFDAASSKSPLDLLFNTVSNFHSFPIRLIQVEERELESATLTQVARLVSVVNDAFGALIEGLRQAGSEHWSPMAWRGDGCVGDGERRHFPHYVEAAHKQFNLALTPIRQLDEATEEGQMRAAILDKCTLLARFVLSNCCREEGSLGIIASLYASGQVELGVQLAEEFQDYVLLIEHCHQYLHGEGRACQLDEYKRKFGDEFELALFDYYRHNGMVDFLLAEKNNPRLAKYLASYERINWIRNIEQHDYGSAKSILKSMLTADCSEERKLVILSLCKLCALCEEPENIVEAAKLSDRIQMILNAQAL